MSDKQPEPQIDQWLYAGIRVARDGTKNYVWISPDGRERWFGKGSASHVIGGTYTVHVTYNDESKSCTRHGDPEFAERPDRGDERVAEWEAADRIARTRLARKSQERNAAKQSKLNEAIEPLEAIAATFTSTTDLDALSAFVLRRINDAHWTARQRRRNR